MRSALPGRSISEAEVTNVSRHGFWLLVLGRELFVPFELLQVELSHATHLYWPALDVDLAVESIEHPERFPLVNRARPNNALHGRAHGRCPVRRRAVGARAAERERWAAMTREGQK